MRIYHNSDKDLCTFAGFRIITTIVLNRALSLVMTVLKSSSNNAQITRHISIKFDMRDHQDILV
jgi:hypothetical protein